MRTNTMETDDDITSLLADIDSLEQEASNLVRTQKEREYVQMYAMLVTLALCYMVAMRHFRTSPSFRTRNPDGAMLLLLIYVAYLLPSHRKSPGDLLVP